MNSFAAIAAWLLVPGPLLNGVQLTTFHGRFLVQRRLVLAAVAVPAG